MLLSCPLAGAATSSACLSREHAQEQGCTGGEFLHREEYPVSYTQAGIAGGFTRTLAL